MTFRPDRTSSTLPETLTLGTLFFTPALYNQSMVLEYSRRFAWFTLTVILIASFSFTLYASLRESPIMDELAHIPAGYSYVRLLDNRLNPEHPPLLKTLSALPLLAMNLNFPTGENAWRNDVNGQWAVGNQFLYKSGNDADKIIRWARVGPILLTLILIVLIYIWSRELLGAWWALLPSFLFALSPNILAHSHYVTTDIAAAFGMVFGTYFFLKFLHHPSKKNLIYAGLAFGVAELTKFSVALLIPYFVFLIAVFYIVSVWNSWRETTPGERLRRFGVRALRYVRALIVVFAIGYVLVVYPVYALFTTNYPMEKQTADTEFILTSFAGGPTPAGAICKPARCPADLDIWMTKNQVTRPMAEYLLGLLMVLQRSAGGNTAYFLGEVSAAGSPGYFPTVYLLKEPLPILAIVVVALLLGLKGILKTAFRAPRSAFRSFMDYLSVNFTEFSMIAFIVLYWAWSINSPLNIGFRHLLPTLPFTYMLAASAWKKWVTGYEWRGMFASVASIIRGLGNAARSAVKYAFLIVLLLWLVVETAVAAPYFLSYFNGFAGGVLGKDAWTGYRYVTDSNFDWGQDLLRLKEFVDARPEIDKVAVDYFGGGDVKYYLGDRAELWWSSRGNPADQGIKWLAVSVNTLESAIQPPAPGFERKPEDEYRWLTGSRSPEPDYRAGTSIFIYKLNH